jgi:ADP-dependent NAD(P)H-hydrate dehydratase / NAD(P)H-hydrate epimerase
LIAYFYISMKIFTADQIRQWDKYTIEHESISSIGLMERAALSCFQYINEHINASRFLVFAGNGNNGGDGLAIARLLKQQGHDVSVCLVAADRMTVDCKTNHDRLKSMGIEDRVIGSDTDMPLPPAPGTWIIDALLGTGQNRPLSGIYKIVVDTINSWNVPVISIDLPTGLGADEPAVSDSVIRARYTLSFQSPKLSFFMPEHDVYVGEWSVLDIGLLQDFYREQSSTFTLTEPGEIRGMILPRKRFSHKGTHGTALLMTGSRGMMGASMLAARACLRSGVGKLVCRVPGVGLDLMQVSVPEALCNLDPNPDCLEQLPEDLNDYQAVGVGPGLGKTAATRALIDKLLSKIRAPLVLDADALNMIAAEGWQERIPAGSVITPHIKEFDRLFGTYSHHHLRIEAALEIASRLGIYIVLKGRYSLVATPAGLGHFNPTGNPGMAKAGTGDVLTGMVTGILAQGYDPGTACRLAVYLHGMAGDLARLEHSEYGIIASDLIEKIGFCYLKVFNF